MVTMGDRSDVMLSAERMSGIFGLSEDDLRGFIKNKRGPQGPNYVETSRGVLYPLADAHRWYREYRLYSIMRQKIREAEAAEAEGSVRAVS